MPVVTSKSIPHQTRMAKPFRPKRRQNITLIDYTTEYFPGVKIRKKVTITNGNLLLTEKYWMSKILPCSRDQNLGLPPQHLLTTKKWPYRWPHFPLRAGIDESKISRKKKEKKSSVYWSWADSDNYKLRWIVLNENSIAGGNSSDPTYRSYFSCNFLLATFR